MLVISGSAFGKGEKIYMDEVLDTNIRTVTSTAVISMGETTELRFDYLGGDGPYMVAKIIHCDWDWKKSTIQEIEFINEFNEFQISDVTGSGSAYIPYYHYRFQVPKVKLSGNYVLKVYDEDNPEKVYLYRRFSVYSQLVLVNSSINLAQLVKHRYSHQQLDFSVNYGQYEIQDPYLNMHVVIRQNNRWDNAIKDLKPTYINQAEKVLRFNFYRSESSFPALREYRECAFGRRQLRIDTWEKSNNGMYINLRTDIDYSNLNYSDQPDRNGRFEIDSPLDADYSHVTFSLKSADIEQDVYVFGQLSDWKLNPRFKMRYDSTANMYITTVLLKNGEYDYSYAVDTPNGADEVVFQGSHSETENDYDVLIYYRAFGKYYDEIVGYKEIR